MVRRGVITLSVTRTAVILGVVVLFWIPFSWIWHGREVRKATLEINLGVVSQDIPYKPQNKSQIDRENTSRNVPQNMSRTVENLCELQNKPASSQMMVYHLGNYGGLGNLMFAFASITGIASLLNRPAVFNTQFEKLNVAFHKVELDIKILPGRKLPKHVSLTEFGPWAWEPNRLIRKLPSNVTAGLCCYFNTWKYFSCIQDYIRDIFTFKDEFIDKANGFLTKVKHKAKVFNQNSSVTFIGVHVRMGDIYLQRKFRRAGFRVAPVFYITTAMDYFRNKYTNAQFILCTDNLPWTRKNLRTMARDVHLSTNTNAMDDMALLSRCNHSIMTQGTFGWWGAYLAGGEVVYYHPPFEQTSGLFNKTYRRENMFPANWTCLTDDPHGKKLNYVRPCKPTDQT